MVARLHALTSARLLIGCGADQQVKIVPAVPGHWVDIPILLDDDAREVCIQSEGTYHPAHYWIYEGRLDATSPPDEIVGVFTDPFVAEFTITLADFETQIRGDSVQVDLTWFTEGAIPLDGKLFVHLYSDLNAPPVAGWDGYPGGALPPANWLPGTRRDSVTLTEVPPGTYTLALGYYDPASGTRYTTQDDDGRLILGEVRVP
jgi:hypothetical protein